MEREQVRDELAKALGYHFAVSNEIGPLGWEDKDGLMLNVDHPIPDTLDGLAKLWDEHAKGWTWTRKHRGDGVVLWIASLGTNGYGQQIESVTDTGDERHDRAALLLAVLKRKDGGA